MSIDAVRKLCAQTEEAITMELATITHDLVEMEARCRALTERIESEAATYRAATARGVSIEEVLEWQARLESQQAAFVQARHAIGTLTEAWNRTQARLIEASQERKVIDRVAERREQAHRTQVGRREQLMLDEAGHRLRASLGKPV